MEIRLITQNEMELVFVFPTINCREQINDLCYQSLEAQIHFEMYPVSFNQASVVVLLKAFNRNQKDALRKITTSFKAKFPNIKINET